MEINLIFYTIWTEIGLELVLFFDKILFSWLVLSIIFRLFFVYFMISLTHLLQNPQTYRDELQKRFKNPEIVDQIVEIQENYKPKLQELENLRRQKNEFNEVVIKLSGEEKIAKINEMKAVAEQIKGLEGDVRELKERLDELLYLVPNLTWDGIPIGRDGDSNVETATYNTKPSFDFEPKNYYDLPVFQRDYLSEKGVEACGFRGYYAKGELAKFQKVLFDWVFDRLMEKGFEYVIPPIFVNEKVMTGTGFFPSGKEDAYKVSDGERDFYLTGTSEAALMFLHSNEVLDLTTPKKLTAWTRCFRNEAGSYGKDTKGGIRVTQFEKIETVLICKPEDSEKVFEEMTNIFKGTLDLLGLCYHDLEVSSGDIGTKNYRQIDIEAWFPAQNTYRELASSSNCTDYQTRTLNIKYKNQIGEAELTHSLNCTGVTNRAMFAIMEQFQDENGRVKIPQVLQARFGKEWLE